MTRSDVIDAEEFVQLGMAARNAFAAAPAITQLDEAGLAEPNLGQIQPELASRLIRRIFAAGLHLAALQSVLGEGPLGDKAATAVEELDIVIHDIQAAVLE